MSSLNSPCHKYLHQEAGMEHSPPSPTPSILGVLPFSTPAHPSLLFPLAAWVQKVRKRFVQDRDEERGWATRCLKAWPTLKCHLSSSQPRTCDWFCCADPSSICISHTETAVWLINLINQRVTKPCGLIESAVMSSWGPERQRMIGRIHKTFYFVDFCGQSNTARLPLKLAVRLNMVQGKTLLPGGNQATPSHLGQNEHTV